MNSELEKFVAFPKIHKPVVARKELGREFMSTSHLKFIGTIKIHGTNACVARTSDGIHYQSRNRIITVDSDQYGFVAAMSEMDWESYLEEGEYVYGEFAGSGIQAGVAISQTPRTFYVFAVAKMTEDGRHWATTQEILERKFPDGVEVVARVAGFYEVQDPFSEESAEKINNLTMMIEDECPVAKFRGVSGIGEGLVWRCEQPGMKSSRYWFKTKGDKHQKNSKVRKVRAKIDYGPATKVIEPMFYKRAKQGMDYIIEMKGEPERKYCGDFIRWVTEDILAEEELEIETSHIKAVLGKMAAAWYLENCEEV